jgi:predicted HTH domain antitoxin
VGSGLWRLKSKTVLVLSDEIIRASGLSESELLLEIMMLLFQQDKISLGKASEILGMNQIQFQRLLADRGTSVHYDVDEFQEDLQHLRAKGWL